jgi:hypothetical protein
MRYLMLLLIVGLAGCESPSGPGGHEAKDAHCLYLDKEVGFARCATNEVICYFSKAYGNCWPVTPTPAASPTPTPQPSPAAAVKK